MYLELTCRFPKPLNKDEQSLVEEEIKNMRLTNPDMDEELERELLYEQFKSYEYINSTIDLTEVFSFNDVDGEHFSCRFLNGSLFTYKGNYEVFKIAVSTVTQKNIYTFKEIEEAANGK